MYSQRILQLFAAVGIILIVWNAYVLLSAADINSVFDFPNRFYQMIVGALLIIPILIYGREETNKNA
ncbi:MAG: hypothetical protein LBU81_00055 [Methanosarcinales archaeon]|jgi:CHASE3 domain sensor protein|nr:hypothetical protein [Methanosarcinales archaeon]